MPRSRSLLVLACLLLMLAARPASGAKRTVEFSDRKVEEAIANGVEVLWNKQDKDGSWSSAMKKYPVGITALAAYAMLETGVKPRDPRMQKALTYLKNTDTAKTYSLAMRCQVWLSAAQASENGSPLQGEYLRLLKDDVHTLMKGTEYGSYGYDVDKEDKRHGDHSNSQYGLLGVWAGSLANVEIPRGYWKMVRDYWNLAQNRDGGWPYKDTRLEKHGSRWRIKDRSNDNSTRTMTSAGIASLYVCLENLQSRAFLECRGDFGTPQLSRGMKWFEDQFAQTLDENKRFPYYMYGVERIGLASGYKYFGRKDWYKEGAIRIIPDMRKKNRDVKNTSFYLLFLVRGRNPVLFNKLEYPGRWNNRPRDLTNLTRWLTDKFERTVNWQIVPLDVPVTEWHDAPFLYIAGNQAPKFTDEHLEKLREYVRHGGTILSVNESDNQAFHLAMKKVYQKIFPEYELTQVPADHPFYTLHYQPTGARAQLEMIHNGVRPLVIHTSKDLGYFWQAQERCPAGLWAWQTAANIFLYQTDKAKLRNRGVSHWPEPFEGRPVATVKVARLKYAGNYNPEPLAWEAFGRRLAERTGVALELPDPIEITDLPKSGAKLAVLTGTGKFNLTDEQVAAIKTFLAGGGKILIDAAGGDSDFAQAADTLIRRFSDSPFVTANILPAGHAVYNLGQWKLTDITFRGTARRKFHNVTTPQLLGMPMMNTNIFISRDDITAALLGYECFDVSGYHPDSAYRLARNLVFHAAGLEPQTIQAKLEEQDN
ncbi:MAG: DUF4159 domain-containing protein [Planctomycetota bacterium]